MATAKVRNIMAAPSNNAAGGNKTHRKPAPPPPHIKVPGNTEEDARRALSRCSSLPDGIDAPVTVQLRNASSRSRRKAQLERNSVAITSSDYYNQRRPQISQLAVTQQVHVPLRSTTGPQSLRPITENHPLENIEYMNKRSSMVADLHDLNGVQITDSRLFRYGSNSSIAAASSPVAPQITNPQISRLKRQFSNASSVNSIGRTDSVLSLTDGYTPSPGASLSGVEPFKMSSQAVPLTAANENQFLPLYINPEHGQMYMFKGGYYIPLTKDNMLALQENASFVNEPPAPDRRSKGSTVVTQPRPLPSRKKPHSRRIMIAPSDHFRFVQILMLLYAFCLNLPVLILFSVPALICSLKVRKANREGTFETAKRGSECVMCFNVLGIMAHVFTMLAVIATFLLLHFVGGFF